MAFVFRHGYKEFIVSGEVVEKLCELLNGASVKDSKYVGGAQPSIPYLRPMDASELDIKWISDDDVAALDLIYKLQVLEKKE